MKDATRKVTNQTDDSVTSRGGDLSFHGDGSLSDSAFLSDFSNGSFPDLSKSPFSDAAASYERNSSTDSSDKRSCPCTDSCGERTIDWSRDQSVSYCYRKECNQNSYNEDSGTQSSIKRDHPTDFEEGDIDWVNVLSLCSASQDRICCSRQDEDAPAKHGSISREEQCNGVIRELQRERPMRCSFTHESLTPIKEWQGLEELECHDSDNGLSDYESEECDALWSPSAEDVPPVRPDFVPKLDLSWVFEDENRKQKRSNRRAAAAAAVAAQRRTEKGPVGSDPVGIELLKTSVSSNTGEVGDGGSIKDKAKSLLSIDVTTHRLPTKCRPKDTLSDENPGAADCQPRNYSVDQALARKLRTHHSSDDVRQVASADEYGDTAMSPSPSRPLIDRTVCLTEASKEDEIFQQQSCGCSIASCRLTESVCSDPKYFDAEIVSASRPSYQMRTNHISKAKNGNCRLLLRAANSCPSRIVVEDYELSSKQHACEEFSDCDLHASDANDEMWFDKCSTLSTICGASHACPPLNRLQILQLPNYYVVDESDSQFKDKQQRLSIPRFKQETEARDTMLEMKCSGSGIFIYRGSVTSRKSDSDRNMDTNDDHRFAEFIKLNAQTTESGQKTKLGDENEEQDAAAADDDDTDKDEKEDADGDKEDDQSMMTCEHRPTSDEQYDVEAAVFRRGRKQRLAKFVCCFLGCRFSCCQRDRCRPCYCDWKCDLEYSR